MRRDLSSTTFQSETFCCQPSCRKSWKLAFTHTQRTLTTWQIVLLYVLHKPCFLPLSTLSPSLVKGASTKLYPAISGLLYTHIFFIHNIPIYDKCQTQQSFWPCHENRLITTNSKIPHNRPAKKFWCSRFQTPFNFLGQKESTCQILGHLAAIKVCHQATEVWYFHTMEIGFQG